MGLLDLSILIIATGSAAFFLIHRGYRLFRSLSEKEATCQNCPCGSDRASGTGTGGRN